MNTTWKC